jgi:hypothetical protein
MSRENEQLKKLNAELLEALQIALSALHKIPATAQSYFSPTVYGAIETAIQKAVTGNEQPKPKYHKCDYCNCVQFGYNETCMFCDTPLETEITKEEFDNKIKTIKQ